MFLFHPLITIVALFVLNIFLPIVVLIFQLWFLLAFKFCLPPGISVSAGLQAELNALPPQGSADVNASVEVDLNGDGVKETTKTAQQLNSDLKQGLNGTPGLEGMIEATNELLSGKLSGKLDSLSNAPLVELAGNFVSLDRLPDKLDAESLTQVDFTASFNTRSAARRRAWHEQHPRLSRTGWSVPLNPAFAGGLAYAAGPEKVRQSIHLILDTEPGERIMRPDFGCGLRRYLMKPNTTATAR